MQKITKRDWVKYFPFDAPRKDQEEFIDFALNAFMREGKRFVIGELPMGIGKSAVAVTIARYLAATDPPTELDDEGEPIVTRGAYVLTTQKILQEQYLADFQKFDMESIKSSSNYQCRFYTEQSCAESLRVLTKLESRIMGTPFFKQCKGACAYKEAKHVFLRAEMGCTNFSYFLAETMYGGALVPRQLLVMDEAHNVEGEVAKFVAVKIDPTSDREVVKLPVPSFADQGAAFDWVRATYIPAALKIKDKLTKKIEKAIAKEDKPSRSTMRAMKDNESLDKHICKLNRFVDSYNPRDWVFNAGENTIEFKPVDISRHTDFHLFKHSPKILMLSATILDFDFYCDTLGIDKSQAAFRSFDSPFDAANRPIHYVPVGKMNAGEIDKTLPSLVEMVREIMKQHPKDKGVIHCFAGETPVKVVDGSVVCEKRIDSLIVGDAVITWNEMGGRFETSCVDAVIDNGNLACVELTFDNGRTLTCTPEHEFLTRNRGWVTAADLDEKDNVIDTLDNTYMNATSHPSQVISNR